MSGGSFNYLWERFDRAGEEEYSDMAAALTLDGYPAEAALTLEIVAHLERAHALAERLAPGLQSDRIPALWRPRPGNSRRGRRALATGPTARGLGSCRGAECGY